MKVVLSNNTKKNLNIMLKLWYLEQKYGEISAFVYLDKLNMWIKIYDPFIDIPEDKTYVQYFAGNGTFDKILSCYGHSWLYNEGIDMDSLQLNNLRFDKDFIYIVELNKDSELCAHLRIEDIPCNKEDIAKNIIEENGVEKVVFDIDYVTLYKDKVMIYKDLDKNTSFKFNNTIFLPCNIGDTIYVSKYNTITDEFDIITRTVKNIRYDAVDNTFMISDGEFYREFGKKVFLTREEAENHLNR